MTDTTNAPNAPGQGVADSALKSAVDAWDAERCRLNEAWHGNKCQPCYEAHMANIAPMIAEAVRAYNAAIAEAAASGTEAS